MLHLNIARAFLLCLFPSCWALRLDLCQGLGNFLLCSILTAAPLLGGSVGISRDTGAGILELQWETAHALWLENTVQTLSLLLSYCLLLPLSLQPLI